MFRTKCSFYDAIVIAVILLCAILLIWRPWVSSEEGAYLVVSTPQGSEEYSLATDRKLTYTENGITLTVVIEDGAVFVHESTCPDGVCKSSGRISKVGETVICAPAGVRLEIKGANADVDFVAG